MVKLRRNPFTPTFGHLPFAFAGREDLIDDVIEGLANQPGDPNRSTIFFGARGTGKTVLAKAIAREAAAMGWVFAEASAHTGMLKELMEQLVANSAHMVPTQGGYDITSVKIGPVGIGWQMSQEDISWRFRFQRIVEQLNEQGVGVLFVIDEVDPKCDDLVEFVSFYQFFVADDLDVAMLLAGLPDQVLGLLGDRHVSFVRRAFQRRLGRIADADIEEALRSTIEDNGKTIGCDALDAAVRAAGGFPYAMQLIGFGAWGYAGEDATITLAHVEKATRKAAQEMEYAIIRPTLYECSQREVEYLAAMAAMDGPCATSEVAARMGIGMTNASNIRRRLIDRGIIIGLRMGVVDFEISLFRDYLREHPQGY